MDGLPAPRLRRRCDCDGLPAQGTVLSNSNGSIQTRRFVGEPGWSDFERTNASVGYALDQELGDIFSFHQNLRYSFSSYDRNPVQTRDFSDATFGPNYGADVDEPDPVFDDHERAPHKGVYAHRPSCSRAWCWSAARPYPQA
jgi:hypothetical protein